MNSRQQPPPPALQPLQLSDAQWAHLDLQREFGGYQVDGFGAIESILVWTQDALSGPDTPAHLALPELRRLSVWETSSQDHDDFHLTAEIHAGLTLVSDQIDIADFAQACSADGPAAARTALQQLLTTRNELAGALASLLPAPDTGGGRPCGTGMTIEVVHVRDPDTACEVSVFADGVECDTVSLWDLDPGRGYTRSGWDEIAESFTGATPAAHAALTAAHRAGATNPYVTDDE